MKHTQTEAWARIQDALPKSRSQVLRLIIDQPGLTAREIEKQLGTIGRHADARISELEKQGMVRVLGTKPNPGTGFAAATWEWTGSDSPYKIKKSTTIQDKLDQMERELMQLRATIEGLSKYVSAEVARGTPLFARVEKR